MSPIEILFLRFLAGFLALCAIHRRITPFLGWRVEALFAVAGAVGVTLYFLMENVALTMTNASDVGVIVAASPLFIGLIAAFVTREEPVRPAFFAGFAIAIAGIALIGIQGFSSEGGATRAEGCLLALVAAMAWAVYSTVGKRIAQLGLSTIATTKRTFAWGLAAMLPFLAPMGFGQGADGPGGMSLATALCDPVVLANLAFLGLLASAACYAMWNAATATIGVVPTSAYIYLSPVVTVACSVEVLDEPLTWFDALGVALTISGLALSEFGGRRRA